MTSENRLKNELRANILKALANLTRVCIIEKLKEGPHSVNELSEKIGESSSITSRHLGILKRAGLIEDHKQGTTVVYAMATDRIPNILTSVDDVIKLNYERYKSFFS
ncbi:MAG: metalloregulator ArsR/SmtB family transcription factor [Spirochaetaceae bacterium]|nr:metalloregulator ArsR/SmtB family transcription factor [Spirochaetaceae bacterium]MCF7938919.1 metalloregulator ArsR/SmtB family transcription factor [Spirochaetales bacterium]